MWFRGLDILDLIGIYPKSDEIMDLRECHSGTGIVSGELGWALLGYMCHWIFPNCGFLEI